MHASILLGPLDAGESSGGAMSVAMRLCRIGLDVRSLVLCSPSSTHARSIERRDADKQRQNAFSFDSNQLEFD